jgi:hypothetical protein
MDNNFKDRERVGANVLDVLFVHPKQIRTPLDRFKNGLLRVLLSDRFSRLFSNDMKRSLTDLVSALPDAQFLNPTAFSLAFACYSEPVVLRHLTKILGKEDDEVNIVDVVRYVRFIRSIYQIRD